MSLTFNDQYGKQKGHLKVALNVNQNRLITGRRASGRVQVQRALLRRKGTEVLLA